MLKKVFKEAYPNIKDSDLVIKDKKIYLNCVTNYFDEDFFSTEELSNELIVQRKGHYIMGFEIVSALMEKQYKALLKRNILNHLKIV